MAGVIQVARPLFGLIYGTWKTDWVIDLDIKGFFDNIDHKILMLAVEKHVPETNIGIRNLLA
jgi:retron-type reverse transcriptase